VKALVMCLADPSINPRPNRIIHLLSKENFVVDCLCYPIGTRNNLPVQNIFSIESRKRIHFLLRIFRGAYFRAIHVIALCLSFTPLGKRFIEYYLEFNYNLSSTRQEIYRFEYDLIIVEHLRLLPLAFRLRHHAKILFDAKEYFPKENEDDWTFRFFHAPLVRRICDQYLSKCDLLITVSPGLVNAYKEEFGVDMLLIRSTPPYQNFKAQITSKANIKLVHHGGADRDRGIENMIEIVKRVDKRFSLDLYLAGDNTTYKNELRQIAADCDRIHFHEPVPFHQIIPMLNTYDVGFYYLVPVGFNVTYNLPNKFFEFIQARLAIAIGPSPDMVHLVNEFQCGFVSSEFTIDSMVETLNSLTAGEINMAKRNSDLAAKTLCYEKESCLLLVALNELLCLDNQVKFN
jgi:glycosyltransferase involved in cell wall biosynthesis